MAKYGRFHQTLKTTNVYLGQKGYENWKQTKKEHSTFTWLMIFITIKSSKVKNKCESYIRQKYCRFP